MFENIKAQMEAKKIAQAKAARKAQFADAAYQAAGSVVGQVAATAVIGLGLGIVDGVLRAVSKEGKKDSVLLTKKKKKALR